MQEHSYLFTTTKSLVAIAQIKIYTFLLLWSDHYASSLSCEMGKRLVLNARKILMSKQ